MIHLDANATSSLRVSAREAVRELVSGELGNPSSIYGAGRFSRTLLTRARQTILRYLLNDERADATVFFTSGGTEGCNSLVRGFCTGSGHILSSSIEHAAILEPIHSLTSAGWESTLVDPERDGALNIEKFILALRQDTALVALMAANNESGAIQPVVEIARLLRAGGYSGAII
jgi:cysteine desulfurase